MEEQDLKNWRIELTEERQALEQLPQGEERSIRLRAWADSTATLKAAWETFNKKLEVHQVVQVPVQIEPPRPVASAHAQAVVQGLQQALNDAEEALPEQQDGAAGGPIAIKREPEPEGQGAPGPAKRPRLQVPQPKASSTNSEEAARRAGRPAAQQQPQPQQDEGAAQPAAAGLPVAAARIDVPWDRILHGHAGSVAAVVAAPANSAYAGSVLTASGDSDVRIWSPANLRSVRAVGLHSPQDQAAIKGVAWSGPWNAGNPIPYLAVARDAVCLFRLEPGQPAKFCKGVSGRTSEWVPTCLEWGWSVSSDRYLVFGCGNGGVVGWSPRQESTTSRFVLRGHTGSVTALAHDHTGNTLASASADKSVRLWDMRNKQCTATLLHAEEVRGVAWLSAQVLASCDGPTISLWDRRSLQSFRPLQRLRLPAQHRVQCLAAGPTATPAAGMLAVGCTEGLARVYDARSWEVVANIKEDAATVNACCWAADGARLWCGMSDHTVRVWSPGA